MSNAPLGAGPARYRAGPPRIGSPSGVNAGMQLVREDLARPWKAGAEARAGRKLYWCGPDAMRFDRCRQRLMVGLRSVAF